MIFGAEGGLRNKQQFDTSEFELCGTECNPFVENHGYRNDTSTKNCEGAPLLHAMQDQHHYHTFYHSGIVLSGIKTVRAPLLVLYLGSLISTL